MLDYIPPPESVLKLRSDSFPIFQIAVMSIFRHLCEVEETKKWGGRGGERKAFIALQPFCTPSPTFLESHCFVVVTVLFRLPVVTTFHMWCNRKTEKPKDRKIGKLRPEPLASVSSARLKFSIFLSAAQVWFKASERQGATSPRCWWLSSCIACVIDAAHVFFLRCPTPRDEFIHFARKEKLLYYCTNTSTNFLPSASAVLHQRPR